MYLYGAGGHAKVIIDSLKSQGIPISGIFDDDPTIDKLLEYQVIGKYRPEIVRDDEVIISIGNNKIRKEISDRIKSPFGSVSHKNAIVSLTASFEFGTVIMQNAVIQACSRIGKHVIINTGAIIEHDCIIKDFVHISPGAILCGNVIIDEGTQIGAGATIIPGIKIGRWSIIGAGCVVLNNVPDFSVVVGNPGHKIKNLK